MKRQDEKKVVIMKFEIVPPEPHEQGRTVAVKLLTGYPAAAAAVA